MKPTPTLQYAPPAPPSWKCRARRWGLPVVVLAALVAVAYPLARFAQKRYEHWAMQRALDRCMTYAFPPGVVPYVEGYEAIAALQAAGVDRKYWVDSYTEFQSAIWRDSPVYDFNKYYGRITRQMATGSGVVFVGGLTNAGGAKRLMVMSAGRGGGNDVHVTASVLDPSNPSALPRILPPQRWSLTRARPKRLLSIMPGRLDPAEPGRVVVTMRYGDQQRDLALTLDSADKLTVAGGFGWRDDARSEWWLDAPEQELETLDARPTEVRMFDGISGFDVPVAIARGEGELIGAYPHGLRVAHADAQRKWKVRPILTWPPNVQQKTHWRLRATSDGRTIFAGAHIDGFPALYHDGAAEPVPIELNRSVRFDAVFSRDDQRLFTTDMSGSTIAWSASDGRKAWLAAVQGEQISAGGDVVAVVEPDQDNDWKTPTTIALLSAKDGAVLRRLETPSDGDIAALSPDGHSIAVAIEEQWLIRDTVTGATRHRFTWPAPGFYSAQSCWLPDGQRVAITGTDYVYIWDLRPPEVIYRLPISRHDPRSHGITVSADGRFLADTTAAQPMVRMWDLHRALPERASATTAPGEGAPRGRGG